MNKLFKITGVSMLAIVATANANAAGYTCEELIEYTSCNPGYTKHTLCPSGTRLITSACVESGTLSENEDINTKEDCLEAGLEWGENICANYDDEIIPQLVAGVTCGKCPAGYLCAGGDAAAETCPAGSYCATAGASVATGKCNVGTFSTGGATTANCTACPATGLTDINGAVVNATTLSTGAESISACIVGPDALFKDNAGIYHFKSNCEYGFGKLTWETTISSAEECEMLADKTGLDWQWNYEYDECQCSEDFDTIKSIVTLPQTESDCTKLGGVLYWEDGKCIVDEYSYCYFGDYGFSCEN